MNCECITWARTDLKSNGQNTLHHPNCKHVNESLMDVYKIKTEVGICYVDNIQDAENFEGALSFQETKMHKEIFDTLVEFES